VLVVAARSLLSLSWSILQVLGCAHSSRGEDLIREKRSKRGPHARSTPARESGRDGGGVGRPRRERARDVGRGGRRTGTRTSEENSTRLGKRDVFRGGQVGYRGRLFAGRVLAGREAHRKANLNRS